MSTADNLQNKKQSMSDRPKIKLFYESNSDTIDVSDSDNEYESENESNTYSEHNMSSKEQSFTVLREMKEFPNK